MSNATLPGSRVSTRWTGPIEPKPEGFEGVRLSIPIQLGPEPRALEFLFPHVVYGHANRKLIMNTQTQERDSLLARCTALLDVAEDADRPLSSAEQNEYDRATTKIRALNLQLDGGTQRPISSYMQPSNELSDEEILPMGATRSRIALPAGHAVKMRAFPNSRAGREDAFSCGQWLKATLLQDPQAGRYCRDHGMNADVMAAAATSPNTAGGALVPDVLANRIIDLREEYGLFRQQADVVPMGSTTETFARRVGGLTAEFVGEGVAGTESDATWDNISLTARKAMVLTRMSSELSDDAIISMADRFTLEIALAFAELEDRCGFNGDGSATDGGIVGILVKAIDASHTKAKIAAITPHNTLGEIDADDLLNLMSAVPQYALRGAAWYCSPVAKSLIFDAIMIAGGGTTSQMLAERMASSFLGYPIFTTPLMADTPGTDYNAKVVVGFGNLRQAAMMGSRREIRVALSSDRYFEMDQVAVKGTERFDINVCNLGSTTVKSPFAVMTGTT